ncbi:hypothetical protein G7046_g7707 [Stylonectria norvegica]|nr:hypothetical protein G7046_g7707 [Stylonectria norvegica]
MAEYYSSGSSGQYASPHFKRSGSIRSEQKISLAGPLDVRGSVKSGGSISLHGDFMIKEKLDAYGSLRLNGSIRVDGKVKAYGNIYASGYVIASDKIQGCGKLKIEGTLEGGDLEIYGNLSINGYLKCRHLVCYGSLTLIGPESTYYAESEQISGVKVRREQEPDWDIASAAPPRADDGGYSTRQRRRHRDGGRFARGETPMVPAVARSRRDTDNGLGELETRVDPDALTTVNDFLDFTEYLPSDMTRSLTLIGKLDQDYANASVMVDELTRKWGQLPSLRPEERPSPVQLRADISENLKHAISSRVFAHAEAVRMSDNVHRHYNKAKILVSKLEMMMTKYPMDEGKSPLPVKSPQLVRNKLTVRANGEGNPKVRRQRVPRIMVPGEVLAPYEVECEIFSDESDVSSDEDSDTPAVSHRTPGAAPRIKIVSNKPQKTPNRPARPALSSPAMSAAAAANAAALLHPPPPNAVVGSSDAPWLQLTNYELAKLRKRMKKNATWTPSETMIARELKMLERGPDAYREAKKRAEDEGKVFKPPVPAPIVDDESGVRQLPAGAISVDSLAAEEVPTSNRGMKLNEAKKLKREALAKLAAEEAEESARKMTVAARLILGGNDNGKQKASTSDSTKEAAKVQPGNAGRNNSNGHKAPAPEPPKVTSAKANKSRTNSRSNAKRKRDAEAETAAETQEGDEEISSRPPAKRTKTETPVPPPQQLSISHSTLPTPENPTTPLLTPGGTNYITHSETPVPLPVPPQGSSRATSARAAVSPTPSTTTVTTSIPVKIPPAETPVPLPVPEQRKSETPVLPPVRETPVRETPAREMPLRETTKRETRGEAAKRTQQEQLQLQQQKHTPASPPQLIPEPIIKHSSSRGPSPQTTPAPEPLPQRRPSSRGKAMSQEPQPSLALDRPRRASTARNTPVPDPRPPSKRTKRPAPGVVSTTNSGGNSAVGKRKAAPKKKVRARRDKGQPVEEEVDDNGSPVDPNEPRYCSCNRVSFGRMIMCDNEACTLEWFHLECVGLSAIPARTTKWYCPECRVLLNIGEKGEVTARGVRM